MDLKSTDSLYPVAALARLLARAPRSHLVLLIGLVLLSAVVDGAGIMLLVPVLNVVTGRPNGHVSDVLLSAGPASDSYVLAALLLLLVGMVGLRTMLRRTVEIVTAKLQYGVVDDLRERCFAGLVHAEWEWLSQGRSSEHNALLVTNISRIGFGLSQAMNFVATGVAIGVYFLTATVLSWQITIVALVSGVVLLFVFGRFQREAVALGHTMGKANNAMHAQIDEGLGAIRLTKIHGMEAAQIQSFNDVIERMRAQQIEFSRRSSLGQALFQTTGAALLAGLLFISHIWWHISPAVVLPLALLIVRLVPMLSGVQHGWRYWLHALPAFEQAERTLAEATSQAEPITALEPAVALEDALELKDVSFAYAGRDRPALDRVSLRFPARSTTAIIGQSGAGKSTLADLITGLLVPTSGEIRVDGQLLTDMRHRWRRSIAYVQQDVFLFHDTIRANLLWSQPGADEAALQLALKQASADFVLSLPLGLDTVVGDGGVRLSGGERQRIALARALLTKPSLLVLDEATSALDMANETAIRAAIDNLHGSLTVIIIGHRLAMIERADQIITMEGGRALVTPRIAAKVA
jgi:ATP-binding cassette subfamily C protein